MLTLAVLLLFGVAVAAIAHIRGRNPLAWFLIGVLGGCLALVLVLVLPDLKEVKRKEEMQRREQERLRELLAQERMKNQAFRGHVTQRLESHDRVLGVDTRSGAAAAELAPAPPPLAALVNSDLPPSGWYLAVAGGQPDGPHDLQTVADRLRTQSIHSGTLVWHASMSDWTPLRDSILAGLL